MTYTAFKKTSSFLFEFSVAIWLLLLFVNFPIYLDYLTGSVNAPKFYYMVYLFAAVYFVTAPSTAVKYLKHPLTKWILLYLIVIALNLVRIYFAADRVEYLAIEWDQFQRVTMFPPIAYLCWRIRSRYFKYLVPVAVVVVIASVVLDFVVPGLMNAGTDMSGTVRAEGMHGNANAAAEALVLALVLLRKHVKPNLFMLFYLLAGLGVILTFSRSGMAIWVLVGLFFIYNKHLSKSILAIFLVLFTSLGVFSNQIEDQIKSIPEYEYKAGYLMERLLFFKNDRAELVEKTADDSRAELATNALKSAMTKPVFGHGIDYYDTKTDVRSHNLIVSMFHVYGLAGIFIWVGLFFTILSKNGVGVELINVGAFSFLAFTFFSHNILEYVFWYVFIAMYLYANDSSKIQLGTGGGKPAKRRRRRRKLSRQRRSGPDGPATVV